MHGNVTDAEWEIFKQAYQFFAAYCQPPANQCENAASWWIAATNAVGVLDRQWADCPLMRELLLAIFSYLEYKAKEKTREMADFVQES